MSKHTSINFNVDADIESRIFTADDDMMNEPVFTKGSFAVFADPFIESANNMFDEDTYIIAQQVTEVNGRPVFGTAYVVIGFDATLEDAKRYVETTWK